MATTTMERRRSDGNGPASAVPIIRGNNQLMSTVWGGVDEREGRFGGMEGQKRVEVEAIGWRSFAVEGMCLTSHIGTGGVYENTFEVGEVFRNTSMKRVSGTKKSISHQALGDVLEYYFWPGECKTQALTLKFTCFENTA